jgi:hypothetical protein
VYVILRLLWQFNGKDGEGECGWDVEGFKEVAIKWCTSTLLHDIYVS